ncbi:MEKHLA domain-containing protein [Streptomyces sp. Ru73]|uniref:PAS domain S-box protein n=1 Tax=Streptomyces sp. Ru73 TaxID=2080748 RepID=UPI000CDDF8B3|nr:PAS domain S-box protein [Streptomyces sp. Ru73]POX36787.1 MEKHLA domain-containing protein [Streptomyces sp. Ru73]
MPDGAVGTAVGGQGLFRGLLEAAPDAMVIVDDSGTIQLVSARIETLFGYRRAELLGRPVEVLVPDGFRGRHARHRRGYAHRREPRAMGNGLEVYGRRKDGSRFPVEVSLSPLETANGLLVSATVRDVSERKAAEARLNGLADLVESSHDAILAKTADGRITYWNAAAQRLYGYTAEEVVGRHVSLLAAEDRKGEITQIMDRLRRGERIEHFETIRVTKSGRLLDVDVTIWPTRAADGTVNGACAIARDISDRKRTEAELTRLYEQQRDIALTLQHSLMGTPPDVPGLHTASRYLPASQGAGVGGDWFDLVPLGAGQVGVLIGDVMGRGLEAAAVMGRLRSAANALARTGMPPEQLMQVLDTVVADLEGQLVTCCYLVIRPDAGELTICSAGHLPVLLASPGEGVRALPAPVSVPLGVGGIPHRQARFDVPPGSVLTLYTDGLIEAPGSDIEDRLAALHEEFAAAYTTAPDMEAAADQLLRALLPDAEPDDDDVTLLLLKIPVAPLASASTELPATAAAVSDGRAFLAAALRRWGCPEAADEACLLVSEILTNAIRHAAGPLHLRLRMSRTELTAEVTDRSARRPQLCLVGSDAESGRGLFLVDTIADSWGTRPTDEGKTIWFTLRLPARPR